MDSVTTLDTGTPLFLMSSTIRAKADQMDSARSMSIAIVYTEASGIIDYVLTVNV